jgi:RHS repeat-associated protein
VIGTPPTRDRGLGADRPERRSVARSVPPAAPIEYVRYSAYGEATVHPVADLNMDGVVTSADLQAWTDLKAGGSSASAFGLDLDFDDYYGPGEGDEDLFWESYDANLGLSGRGRVSTPGVAGRIGYAGYQWDQTAGAYHVRYRVYLPEIGRWTRRDPLGYVDGMGLYEYVGSRPTQEVDGYGLDGAGVYYPPPSPGTTTTTIKHAFIWYYDSACASGKAVYTYEPPGGWYGPVCLEDYMFAHPTVAFDLYDYHPNVFSITKALSCIMGDSSKYFDEAGNWCHRRAGAALKEANESEWAEMNHCPMPSVFLQLLLQSPYTNRYRYLPGPGRPAPTYTPPSLPTAPGGRTPPGTSPPPPPVPPLPPTALPKEPRPDPKRPLWGQ